MLLPIHFLVAPYNLQEAPEREVGLDLFKKIKKLTKKLSKEYTTKLQRLRMSEGGGDTEVEERVVVEEPFVILVAVNSLTPEVQMQAQDMGIDFLVTSPVDAALFKQAFGRSDD